MASRQEAVSSAPRLYLVTEAADDAGATIRQLEQAFGAADVAAVLLRLPETDERSQIKLAKGMASAVQGSGVALLLDGRADLVARAGADGAHLTGYEAFGAAVGGLKPDRIAGAGGLKTRHDAMLAAEAGADYVMFGEPDTAGHRPAVPAIVERLAWWSEVFEIPCVGFANAMDEVSVLAASGADFVALGEFVWKDGQGAAAAIAEAAGRLQRLELV
jgi:thiamine-phosphate pyrophosphorylase